MLRKSDAAKLRVTLARNARLLPLREEAGILPVVQVKDMAMLRRVCEGGATALVRFSCFHASLD